MFKKERITNKEYNLRSGTARLNMAVIFKLFKSRNILCRGAQPLNIPAYEDGSHFISGNDPVCNYCKQVK